MLLPQELHRTWASRVQASAGSAGQGQKPADAVNVRDHRQNSHLLNHGLLHPLMHSVYMRVEGQVVGSICIVLQQPSGVARWHGVFCSNTMKAPNSIVS